jgi:hypothetical protein
MESNYPVFFCVLRPLFYQSVSARAVICDFHVDIATGLEYATMLPGLFACKSQYLFSFEPR